MKLFTRLVLLTIFTLASIMSVSAVNYYVATDGNDANAGTLAQPFRTPQLAIMAAQPGDTIYLRGGTYDSSHAYPLRASCWTCSPPGGGTLSYVMLSIGNRAFPPWTASTDSRAVDYTVSSGTSQNPITVRAYPGEVPLFNGYGVSIYEKSYWTVEGIVVNDSNIEVNGPSFGGYSVATHDITIRGNEIMNFASMGGNNPGSIKVDGAPNTDVSAASRGPYNIVIENNLIHDMYAIGCNTAQVGTGDCNEAGPGGLTGRKPWNTVTDTEHVSAFTIVNCQNPNQLCVNGLIVFRNNTIYNTPSGMYFKQPSPGPVYVYNNTWYNMQNLGVWTVANIIFEGNLVYDLAAKQGARTREGGNSIEYLYAGRNQTIRYNTFVDVDTFLTVKGNGSNHRIENNVIYGLTARETGGGNWGSSSYLVREESGIGFSDATLDANSDLQIGNTINNNCFITPYPDFRALTRRYTGCGSYCVNRFNRTQIQTLFSFDLNSVFITDSNKNNIFQNAANDDYRLLTSGAIAACAGMGAYAEQDEPVPTAPPWVVEDFSTYTSTANMLSDPRGIYSEEDSYNTDPALIQLVSPGVDGSPNAMQYSYPDRTGSGTRCNDFSIGRNLVLPSPQTEIWFEAKVKFSTGFATNAPSAWNCASAPSLKFMFGRVLPSSRFQIIAGASGSGQMWETGYPGNEEPSAGQVPTTQANLSKFANNQYFPVRGHWKIGANGVAELWLNGTRVVNFVNVDVTAANQIYGIALGRNMNQGPAVPQTLTWGSIKVWNTDPEWTVVVPPADTTPPTATITAPTAAQILVAGSTQTPLTVTTNEAATCKWSANSGDTYASMTNTLTGSGSTSHTATFSGLSNGTSYTRYVRCQDTAGNSMVSSTSVSFSVASPAPPPGALTNECSSPQAGWLWCDDFETDRLGTPAQGGGYFEYTNDGGEFIRIAATGVGGSTAMRARFEQGDVDAGHLSTAFGRTPQAYMQPIAGTVGTDYRDIYWRVYLKNQAGWTGGGADKLSRGIVFANSNWAQAAFGHVWSGGANSEYLLLDPASGTDTAGNLQTTTYNDFPNMRWLGISSSTTPLFSSANVGAWHCIEARMKLNDAGQSNGVFELWIDNSLQAQKTGMNWLGSYNAYGINAINLENYWNSGSTTTQERHFDNYIISTQRIGCGTPPPPRVGDLNNDGVVNVSDVILIITNFKRRMNYDAGADINNDGTVNIFDMVLLGRNWG